jgi:hypothetical protein
MKDLFRQHVAEPVFISADGVMTTPLIVVQVKLFEFGLVAPKKVLRITDKDRLVGRNGVYHRSPAWAGEVGQPVTQSVEGITHTSAGKGIKRHGTHSI